MTNLRIALAGVFTCLAIYLFVSAPTKLPEVEVTTTQHRAIDVSNMFNAMNAINDTARRIYTSRIVGAGKEAGLEFGEDWAEPSIEKGPLPALFTRLVAKRMETKPPMLGLYLGSDEPINKSNLFSGSQAIGFAQLKETEQSVFLQTDESGYVAMYPDVASAQPCVSCHNEHADSPKTDWVMNEIMGATTWTYPNGVLGSAEYLEITDAFFTSIKEAYEIYIDKAATFQANVKIADEWPEQGKMALPDAATFMAEVLAESADTILNDLVLNPNAKFDGLDLAAALNLEATNE